MELRDRGRLGTALVLMSLLVVVAWPLATTMTGTATTAHAATLRQVPAGLPQHFSLGLMNGPSTLNWMTGSGVPWDMRYQYLSGGANTGTGWATWNADGAFATNYMNASANAGYLPVFTYYQILQTAPASGSGEAAQVYSNLNNAASMRAYFADFRLLLDKARAFGRPVIVHVEPDLFGYMQQRVLGGSNSAADIPVSVASSGYADAAGLPDTFQGFNWALLRLRDQVAPNVIMAQHVSHWSTGVDIGTSSSTSVNMADVVARTAAFARTAGLTNPPAGVSTYDLLFFGPSDRDAAYYEIVRGDGGRHWWDVNNQTLPNFARYQQYVAGVTAATERRAILWQIPLGNTIMRSQNNTDGHYQDNRVQYFLGNYPSDGHLASFAEAGVIGMLFGRGANGPTTYTDAKGDGVTNPAPINGNDRTATVSDDDGGYLRDVATTYYQRGVYQLGSAVAPTQISAPTVTRTSVPSATRTSAPAATRTATSVPAATRTVTSVPAATRTSAPAATRTAVAATTTPTRATTSVPTATRTSAPARTPTATRTSAPTRTPVTASGVVDRLEAWRTQTGAQTRWHTTREPQVQRVELYRSRDAVLANATRIASFRPRGSATSGADYSFYDGSSAARSASYYWVVVRYADGRTENYGPVLSRFR